MTLPTYTSGLLFTRAHKAVRGCIYTVLERYSLTPSYWAILGITSQAPEGVRLAAVARQMDVKAPLVTMLAGELIERGLITRVPHHTDGRAKLLVVTAKGKTMAAKVEHELDSEIARVLSGANAKDLAVFQKTLEIIITNTETE